MGRQARSSIPFVVDETADTAAQHELPTGAIDADACRIVDVYHTEFPLGVCQT